MKYSLTKLLLKTRIPDIFWIFFILLIPAYFFISLMIYSVNIPGHHLNTGLIHVIILAVSIISLFIFMLSHINITKSDNDLILGIPLKKIDIFRSFYILNIILMLPVAVFLIIFSEFLFYGYDFLISIVDALVLFLLSINLSFIDRYLIKDKMKMVIPSLFTIFLILPIFINFGYSITSIFSGYILNGTVIAILLFIISFIYMIKNTNNLNVIYNDKNLIKEIKSENIGGSPLKAMYLKNTYLINAVYAFNNLGKTKVYNKRLNIKKILYIFSVIAVIYIIINIQYYNTFIVLYFDIYMVILLPLYYQIVTNPLVISLERPWLSLTSMDNGKYIRNLVLLNALSSFIAFIPVVLATFIIMILHFNNTTIITFIYFLIVPYILSVFYLYISALVSPYQIRDVKEFQQFSMHTGESLVRAIFLLILFFITVILNGITVFFPKFIISLAVYYMILIVLTTIMINSKKLSNHVCKRLIDSHFV